ncbi:hypothetical protein AVEN_174661-1 [Araneus ventricosus]|uniref:Uncharacterized protein n=1 Tax=Araneus ventricosus TaxID=182803 RepID=A0A4Y2RUI1_ARAVE|nr:hypothetical protein AVEN_174661-1 [Araneus ventricosus]
MPHNIVNISYGYRGASSADRDTRKAVVRTYGIRTRTRQHPLPRLICYRYLTSKFVISQESTIDPAYHMTPGGRPTRLGVRHHKDRRGKRSSSSLQKHPIPQTAFIEIFKDLYMKTPDWA